MHCLALKTRIIREGIWKVGEVGGGVGFDHIRMAATYLKRQWAKKNLF